ncbi:KPSFVRF-amide 2 [Caenorhabditis elegans]|uniref:FMRFamide-like neuropeptides 9 n=1 Tax=Caenorhabditis elegans TaxID=6239 RepID=FLP09_CAEEL|nr:KPSFVRF-amide 2 [Caenorhabditis elegans]Q18502.2 RecName: Full=FMRFamide-like neuropeptides 9; Contains: RecName: Full=KPSFVRF-amide 1; Contains: RecName: Full=KPSFVRF-amide 2; Flags: Precursor [Caenorhabditis elegans]CAA93480.2 KPSFVRF-amide 2 [Caenorhabditis elegans]|eukprot:NP_502436.2 KPSFVRF-amide 2 [Caenorhabditis elegans]
MNQFYALFLVACIAAMANAYEEPDLDALAEFCGKESNRKYCDQIAQLATQHAIGINQEQVRMEKRKPSFVRFGKRSGYPLVIDDEEMRMDKRKPSFVRFGRK